MKHLDHDICYQALKTRDARFDGRFFTGVTSTGIFCRPICPANTPKAENCTFFSSANAALQAGFRPCLRCRPESAPLSAAWSGTEAVVKRALTLIDNGVLDEGQTLDHLCDRLGVGERQLRRLFQKHLGASPKQVALNRRLFFAKKLLHQTSAPIGEIALSSGFNSLRRFNDAYKSSFGFSPRQERKQILEAPTLQGITLSFPYRPPYDWEGILDFFRQRAIDPIEWVSDECYHRKVAFNGHQGEIIISHDAEKHRLQARILNLPTQALREISCKIRKLFDVDGDPEAIAKKLYKDKALKPLIDQSPGLRLPGAWDGFEIAVRAVIGQQISVKAARTICKRVVERINTGAFPTPKEIMDTSLDGLGLTGRRIDTLKKLAENWQNLDPAKPVQDTLKELCALPGIGPWTAHYIVMRSLSDPDTYPVADLGLIRSLEKLNLPAHKSDLEARAEHWRPWRAYGALYLWRLHS